MEDEIVKNKGEGIEDVITFSIERGEGGANTGNLELKNEPTLGSIGRTFRSLSYVPGVQVLLYSPPRQRQKWGSKQILPHVNWGDLFFDLFYVAGFYNLGNILVDSPSWEGVLYFIGCFSTLWELWSEKLMYDGRFVYGDDLFHKLFETIFLIVLGTAVSYIAPVSQMSNPTDYVDMFGFCISLTVASLLNFARILECYIYGHGQRNVIHAAAIRSMKSKTPLLLFYGAATIISGIAHFRNNDGNDEHRELAGEGGEGIDCDNSNYLPIVLILVGYLIQVFTVVIQVVLCFPKNGEHKKYSIPFHVEFFIHRQGEWSMLVLGESVLSLLIVDANEDNRYFSAFYCGLATVILLQLLHFRNQPHDPNAHAMRRSKEAGVTFGNIFPLYSAALIAVGSSFKLFLYGLSKNNKRRRLPFSGEPYDIHHYRSLAGGGSNYGCSPSGKEKEQNVAHLFCIAMAIVFLCLDVMVLLHIGLKKGVEKCKSEGVVCKRTGTTKIFYNTKGLLLLACRIAVTIFIATLGLWQTDPARLAELGLVTVFCQLVIRFLGNIAFQLDEHLGHSHHHHHIEGMEDDEHEEGGNNQNDGLLNGHVDG